MISIREFLNAIAEELETRGTTSRDLVMLQFEADSGDLRVLVDRKPHPAYYPSLGNILGMVCATCEEDGITLAELERITFFDTEINLECSSLGGEAVYTYPIEATTVH
jgi:hypothetical protein